MKMDTKEFTNVLIKAILETFAEIDPFIQIDSPSFFLVYAHDNSAAGVGDAAVARQLIEWLKVLRAKIYSDKSTTAYWYFRENQGAYRDILWNQQCLLPQSHGSLPAGHIGSVDKVILCGSEVLQNYYQHDKMQEYANAIKELYDRLEREGRASDQNVKNEMEILLKKYRDHESFHHVVTELAYLDIRAQRNKEEHGIIPVSFNGDGVAFLPFLDSGACLWLKPKDGHASEAPPSQHKLLFNILHQLYPERHDHIKEFNSCYETCVTMLSQASSFPTREEFDDMVSKEIRFSIGRLDRRAQANIRTSIMHKPQGFYEYPSHRRSAHFTTRKQPLEEMNMHFEKSHHNMRSKIVALHGLGGCGKSQIALEYCRQSEDNKTYSAIFWVDMSSPAAAKQDFATIAKKLSKANFCATDPETSVQYALNRIPSWPGKWLLVFDNFDDSTILGKNIQNCFPQNSKGCILITTRDRDIARSLGPNVDATSLSEEEAVTLLLSRTGTSQSIAQASAECRRIARRLGYHALALHQAAAYIDSRSLELSMFLPHYDKRAEVVLGEVSTSSLWDYTRRLKDAPDTETDMTALTTFEASYSMIYGNAAALKVKRQFLNLVACMNMNEIFEEAFKFSLTRTPTLLPMCTKGGLWDSFKFQDLLRDLWKLSLIQNLKIDVSGARFSMHPVVSQWLRIRMGRKARREFVKEAGLIVATLQRQSIAIEISTKGAKVLEVVQELECCEYEEVFPVYTA